MCEIDIPFVHTPIIFLCHCDIDRSNLSPSCEKFITKPLCGSVINLIGRWHSANNYITYPTAFHFNFLTNHRDWGSCYSGPPTPLGQERLPVPSFSNTCQVFWFRGSLQIPLLGDNISGFSIVSLDFSGFTWYIHAVSLKSNKNLYFYTCYGFAQAN